MRVFITGATGYIGFAVAQAFRRSGHEVYGLSRSDAGARKLAGAEIHAVRGTLQEPASYRDVAQTASLLVHAAADYAADVYAVDRKAVDALIELGSAGASPKTLIYTSGVWVYGNTGSRRADETSPLSPPRPNLARPAIEAAVLEATSVRGLVVRPGCVYGGAGGLTASWFTEPAAGRAATVVGDGTGHWSVVHLDDLAEGYLRLGESSMGGEIFNLTDRSRDTVGAMARAAASAVGFGGGVRLLPVAEALQEMGPIAECLALDQHVDSGKAVRRLGWQPRHGGFVNDVASYALAALEAA
jgi:nucleoside-diphosphate-sugar epimerase